MIDFVIIGKLASLLDCKLILDLERGKSSLLAGKLMTKLRAISNESKRHFPLFYIISLAEKMKLSLITGSHKSVIWIDILLHIILS